MPWRLFGIRVVERVRHQIPPRPENYAYLQTKASKMGHLLSQLPTVATASGEGLTDHVPQGTFFETALGPDNRGAVSRLRASLREAEVLRDAEVLRNKEAVPSVTLSYAQSLDGSIAAEAGKPFQLSNPESQALTHRLRSMHDAVLVGINTLLSDDPRPDGSPGRGTEPPARRSGLPSALAPRGHTLVPTVAWPQSLRQRNRRAPFENNNFGRPEPRSFACLPNPTA